MPKFSVDVLKVAHHGSNTSTTAEFLQHIRPEYAVISVSANNSYGLPDERVSQRLNDVGAQVLTTAECGAVTFTVKPDGIFVNTMLK